MSEHWQDFVAHDLSGVGLHLLDAQAQAQFFKQAAHASHAKLAQRCTIAWPPGHISPQTPAEGKRRLRGWQHPILVAQSWSKRLTPRSSASPFRSRPALLQDRVQRNVIILLRKHAVARMDASNVSIGTLQAAQRACRCYIDNSECTTCQPSDQSCMSSQHVAAGPYVRHETGEAQLDTDHFWKRLLVCLPSTKRLMVSKLTSEISGPRAISRSKPYSTPSTTWTQQRK